MIRSIYRTSDGQLRTDLQPSEYVDALQQAGSMLWIDLGEEPESNCEPILRHTFGFHPLAIDDALKELHIPKVDDWGTYLYVVLHAVAVNSRTPGRLETFELDIFLGERYFVTYRTKPIAALDRLWAACLRDERHLRRSVAHLLYELADEMVAEYMPVVERFDEEIDEIEDLVFSTPQSSLLERLFELKRALVHMRRIIAPQQEVLNKLARGDFDLIHADERVFFRDLYDHLVRLHDITEGLRDLAGGALDTYLSVVNNRLNEVMKTLTIITTLFMPISFLAGFFGMNFFQPVVSMPLWTGWTSFAIMLGMMVVVPTAMFLWIRKRAWM